MTSEEQDAVVGRTLRELRDTRERLAKLRARARELGESISAVGYQLNNSPELLRLSGEATDTRFLEQKPYGYRHGEQHVPRPEHIDLKSVLQVRDETRECILEEKRLSDALKQMGFREP